MVPDVLWARAAPSVTTLPVTWAVTWAVKTEREKA
jgi:hypothetical protein